MLTVTWAAFMLYQSTARRVLKAVRKRLRPSLPKQALRFGGEDDVATSSPSLFAARPDITHAHIYALSKKNTRETWSASHTGEPVLDDIRRFQRKRCERRRS